MGKKWGRVKKYALLSLLRTTMLLTLLSATLLTAQPVLAKENGTFTNQLQNIYNDQNGLPTSGANAVLQTSDGYIWIGGYGGLVRYDGREFLNYSMLDSGLTSSGIRALFEDSRGRLWVGTNDKGVFLYEGGRFTACTMPEGNRYRSVRCFEEDAYGTIFVGTSTGLAKVDADNYILPVETDRLEGQTIYSLSFDKNDVLWGTAGTGFAFALKGDTTVYWLKPGDLNENENYAVLARDNIVYIGTGGNVVLRLTLRDDRYDAGSFQVDTYDTGELHTVNAMCLTDEGKLWIGCETGSGWFDGKMQFYTLNNMEQNTFLSCIMEDYEGNLWMASTKGGVFQLMHGRFLNANQKAGLQGKSTNAIVKLGMYFYVASDYGLYIVDENWEPVENELTRKLDGVRIRHLFVDSTGKLWISTYGDMALLCYTPVTENLISITGKDGLLGNKVRKVIELENGDIAVATIAGVNILRDEKVIESYGIEQGLANPVILSLLQTADGTLLAGSDGMGIYAIKDGKTYNFGEKQGLDTGSVLRMREDEKAEGVWISAGSGLYFMDANGQIREITEFRYGIGSVFDIQVMEDDIWLMKSSGLIIVPRAALLGQQEMSAVQYGRESGLSSNLTANSWNLYENGILYLCTVNGIYLLDNSSFPKNNIPPKIAIDEITVQQEDGTTTVYKNPAALVLTGDTQRVTIRFACLSFAGAPCTIEYCLKNFDEQPVVISAEQADTVSYTNLRGGNYVFRLSARNADGVEGEKEIVLPITKKLKFFEQPLVWVGMAVLLAFCIFLIARLVLELKTRQLKRRQQEYKDITDQALKTIANTIDAKDKYTKGHSVRVADYSRELARRMGLQQEEQEKIYYIALLHDIGKIGIPDAILNKPGKLTDEEFDIMRSHTRIGGDILKDFTALSHIVDGALSHHENYDGTGYPEQKSGEDIPFVARIIRVADSYDAMATRRSYRNEMDRDYILSEFRRFSEVQFEPHIAQLMVEMISDGFTSDSQEICSEGIGGNYEKKA